MTNKIMTIAKGGVIVCAIACTTSCGLYKKYERPQVNIPENVMRDAQQYANTTDTLSFGDVAWREVFTDPQLQSLIQQGLEQNDDIYKAAANVEQVEAALKCARLAFLPSVAFAPSGSLSKYVTGDLRHGDWTKIYALPVSASWTVDIFGNLLAQKRGAQVNLEMMKDYEHVTRSKVICGIANLYYTLLMLDRQMEILTDMEKLTSETYEMMKLQKELRGARETSVVSAQAANLSVKAQMVDMKRQIHEMENSLSLLIGIPAQGISRSTLAQQNLPEKFSTGIAIDVLRARPDVHAAEMNLAKCFYDVSSARAQMYPTLTLSATGSFNNGTSGTINPGQLLANFAAGLTQPIFANGRLTAQLKVAKLDYEIAVREWEHSILSAGSEVSNYLVEYNSAQEQGDLDRQQVEALKKSVEYTRDLFKMGSSSYLEVISAQSSLLNAEISEVTQNFNKMQAVVNLYSALGGGKK